MIYPSSSVHEGYLNLNGHTRGQKFVNLPFGLIDGIFQCHGMPGGQPNKAVVDEARLLTNKRLSVCEVFAASASFLCDNWAVAADAGTQPWSLGDLLRAVSGVMHPANAPPPTAELRHHMASHLVDVEWMSARLYQAALAHTGSNVHTVHYLRVARVLLRAAAAYDATVYAFVTRHCDLGVTDVLQHGSI